MNGLFSISEREMLRRPRPGEVDLEEMMKDFEKESKPSATVVSKRKSPAPTAGSMKRPKSVFAQQREAANNLETTYNATPDDNATLPVLTEIVEKRLLEPAQPPTRCTSGLSSSFPEVLRLEPAVSIQNSRPSKKSLFSQQFMKMKKGLAQSESLRLDDCVVTSELSGMQASTASHQQYLDGMVRCFEVHGGENYGLGLYWISD